MHKFCWQILIKKEATPNMDKLVGWIKIMLSGRLVFCLISARYKNGKLSHKIPKAK